MVEYALGSVDEFADLEGGGPHGALSASDGCAAVAVVKELVRNEGAAETEETEFYTAKIEEAGGGFVEDVEVVDGVLGRPKFFEDEDVFARAPYCVNRDLELDLTCEEKGEFGEELDIDGGANDCRRVFGRQKVRALCGRDKGRVHGEMAKGSVIDSLKTVGLWTENEREAIKRKRKKKHTKETKVASVNDSLCVYFASKVVEGRKTTTNVCDAQYSAMMSVEYLCLGVDRAGKGRACGRHD